MSVPASTHQKSPIVVSDVIRLHEGLALPHGAEPSTHAATAHQSDQSLQLVQFSCLKKPGSPVATTSGAVQRHTQQPLGPIPQAAPPQSGSSPMLSVVNPPNVQHGALTACVPLPSVDCSGRWLQRMACHLREEGWAPSAAACTILVRAAPKHANLVPSRGSEPLCQCIVSEKLSRSSWVEGTGETGGRRGDTE